MPRQIQLGVMAEFATAGDMKVLIIKHPGRWRCYTWHCVGCENPPSPRRRLRRSVARRRGRRHGMRCRAGAE